MLGDHRQRHQNFASPRRHIRCLIHVGWLLDSQRVVIMDDICLPVRYDELTEKDIQAHLRYCGSDQFHASRVEFVFCDVGIVVPMVKATYRIKGTTLNVLIRSGSFGPVRLLKLKEELSSLGYDLKTSYTSKRKLLSRVIVRLPIDDGTVAVSGLNVLKSIARAVDLSWPSTLAVGYPLGSEALTLPGTLSFREPFRNAGYRIGLAVGRLFKKALS